jgi:hypothetical protein
MLVAALAIAILPGIAGLAAAPAFADDFESGAPGAWTQSSRFAVQQQLAFGGAWAGRITTSGQPGYASKTLGTSLPDVFFDVRVNVQSSSGTVRFLRLLKSGGGGIASLRLASNGTLSIRNDVSGTIETSVTKMSKGVWHEVQVHARVAGNGSMIEVWLDGSRIADLSTTTSLGTKPVARVQLGSEAAVTMDAAYDDVVVATSFVTTDVTPPTVPQDLAATSVAGNRVDLQWSPATDETGVASYGIYRDGEPIGSAQGTQTTFSDTSVMSLTSYSYTVDAVDRGDHRSARSTPLVVGTPALDTTPPTVPTGLAATVHGATSVDLSWEAATDDVEVTAYTIVRDGGEIATIPARTTFTDATTHGGTTYKYEVEAVDAAGNRSDRSSSVEATTELASVLVAAGDICQATPTNCAGTASLVEASAPDVAVTLGDNQYSSGTLAQYLASYDLQWGRFRDKTKPSPGNHEWNTANAQGYRDYFGPSFLTNGGTWYSFDLGAWHVVSLDSECRSIGGCGPGSPVHSWLQQDLSADDHACTLAYWHKPRFSSGANHGSNTSSQPFWDLLGSEGAEIVLNGHEHNYERFAPQTPLGVASTSGIRQFVVGTGGNCCYPFGPPIANSEVRITGTRGIVELTLAATSYSWRFIAVGGAVLDSGTGDCH